MFRNIQKPMGIVRVFFSFQLGNLASGRTSSKCHVFWVNTSKKVQTRNSVVSKILSFSPLSYSGFLRRLQRNPQGKLKSMEQGSQQQTHTLCVTGPTAMPSGSLRIGDQEKKEKETNVEPGSSDVTSSGRPVAPGISQLQVQGTRQCSLWFPG